MDAQSGTDRRRKNQPMPQHSDDPLRRIDALQQRFSALCGAFQRVNASLDLGTVLQEIVETARTLTGSRYGLITTVDDSVNRGTSSPPASRRKSASSCWTGRKGPALRAPPGPAGAMRLRDFPAYLRSLGIPTDPFLNRTLQGTPLRHRQAHLGTFFLAEKEGGLDFTDEDEEVLLLFASQAATPIVNARTYRNEQRARADLEALIDTSPVGVVVFNARRPAGIDQSRSEADCRATPPAGSAGRAAASGGDVPAGGRSRGGSRRNVSAGATQ